MSRLWRLRANERTALRELLLEYGAALEVLVNELGHAADDNLVGVGRALWATSVVTYGSVDERAWSFGITARQCAPVTADDSPSLELDLGQLFEVAARVTAGDPTERVMLDALRGQAPEATARIEDAVRVALGVERGAPTRFATLWERIARDLR